jgi:C-terminal processing protease CtpA/Prc
VIGGTGFKARLGRLILACLALPATALALAQSHAPGAAAPIPVANAGFEEGTAGAAPPGWGGTISAAPSADAPGAPFQARLDPDNPRAGRASARLESVAPSVAPNQFGTITASVDARAYRGRRVRLTGAVRTEIAESVPVGLWLRVDRAGQRMGFFDNMQDRPIRNAAWADYAIEGDVAADAERLVFGMLLAGPGKAWLDDVRLEDIGPARSAGLAAMGPPRVRDAAVAGDAPARPLDARGLVNLHAFARLYGLVRFFHPSDEAAHADWNALALTGVERVEGARNPAELAAALNAVFRPVAPGFDAYVAGRAPPPLGLARPPGAATALRWEHVGLGSDPGNIYHSARVEVAGVAAEDVLTERLPGGVAVRLPMVVWRDAAGATLPRASAALPAGAKPAGYVPAGFDRTTRLAATVAAWSMFQHFYPYFDVVHVDWDAELDRTLRAAAMDGDDFTFSYTLRRLVAALHDGHGGVGYWGPPRGALPFAWDWVEGRLVVTNVAPGTAGIARGDVVTAIDGVPAGQALAARMATYSGSEQWTRVRGLADLLSGPPDRAVALTLAGAEGPPRIVHQAYRETAPEARIRELRPEPVAELAPGIFYVDIDRVTEEQYRARLADLAGARGLVFDLRGYPRMSPDFLTHLSDRPLRSAVFAAPTYRLPDRRGVTYVDGGWNLPPAAPRFTANLVFITNGSAISYAESVLGVVAGNHLADIVGEPSAGANGNNSRFALPGGYSVSWTAMRVTNRDGSQHHLIGVRPTIPASRTLAGVRAGRDELLERALALVQGRASRSAAAAN